MELAVYNIKGNKTARTVALNEEIFAIEPNDHAIFLDVKQYLANKRQGTHKTKERWEVKGSTRKLRRQKGTGFARVGDIKSPIFRGGGRVFGPKPRDYSFKINKKVKRLARKSALSYKIKDNSFLVVEDFSLEEPKTKKFVEILKNFNLENKKALLVLPEGNRGIVLSARNLPKANVAQATDLNTYMILNADHLLVCESSVKIVEDILLKK